MDEKILLLSSRGSNTNEFEIKINNAFKNWYKINWNIVPVYYNREVTHYLLLMQK